MKLLEQILTNLHEATSSEERLTHLEHAEDHIINAGNAGFAHAKNTLEHVHNLITGKNSEASVSTKFDGSPSIIFGRHPETGKFFVASKSAFNKTPKINYTDKDIDENHGHAPGLASKLKMALKHLPKVTPSKGVFQGDVMHSGGAKSEANPEGDVVMHGGEAHFTPNTITYTTKKPGEADKAANSKIGVAVHTAYEGPSFGEMKAVYNSGLKGFKEHKDVHLIDTVMDPSKSKYNPQAQSVFDHHLSRASEHSSQIDHSAINGKHIDHLKTYINKNVRTGEGASVEGYKKHLHDIAQKAADKLKTDKAKKAKLDDAKEMIKHIDKHSEHFEHMFNAHGHLQAAKDQLVHALASHSDYGQSIGGKAVKPEGFVAVINNRPTKLVDREEFSRANFARER